MDHRLVWLLDTLTLTKEQLVSEDGIGSDLPPLVAAFDVNHDPIGQAQVATSSESREDQFRRLIAVAALMRSGWHAESLAIALEGYLVLNSSEKITAPLVSQFAEGNPNVVECISVIFATADGYKAIFSLPYKIELGRKITWLTSHQQFHENDEASGIYPDVLYEIFEITQLVRYSEAVPSEIALMAVATEIVDRGFHVVCQMLDEEAQRWINEW